MDYKVYSVWYWPTNKLSLSQNCSCEYYSNQKKNCFANISVKLNSSRQLNHKVSKIFLFCSPIYQNIHKHSLKINCGYCRYYLRRLIIDIHSLNTFLTPPKYRTHIGIKPDLIYVYYIEMILYKSQTLKDSFFSMLLELLAIFDFYYIF